MNRAGPSASSTGTSTPTSPARPRSFPPPGCFGTPKTASAGGNGGCRRSRRPAVPCCSYRLNIEIADFYATGPEIMFRFGVTLAQDLTYTIGWLAFGILLLIAGIYLKAHAARIAALLLIAVTTFKCFLYDLSSLGGLHRVGSFVGLAFALTLVSLALQKYVLRPPQGNIMTLRSISVRLALVCTGVVTLAAQEPRRCAAIRFRASDCLDHRSSTIATRRTAADRKPRRACAISALYDSSGAGDAVSVRSVAPPAGRLVDRPRHRDCRHENHERLRSGPRSACDNRSRTA